MLRKPARPKGSGDRLQIIAAYHGLIVFLYVMVAMAICGHFISGGVVFGCNDLRPNINSRFKCSAAKSAAFAVFIRKPNSC